jgi:hypothetical protein
LGSLQSKSARSFQLGSLRNRAAARSFWMYFLWSTSRRSIQCVHGGAEPSGEYTRSERDKRAAHCVGAAASSPPGERVDAHGRRRGVPDKTRRTHRHRESGTHEGTTGQPGRTRSPHRHSKGQPAAAPEPSPSSTRRCHQRRSSERAKNATAVVGKEGPAEVTTIGPSNETQMRRRHRTKAPGWSQDATAVVGKEGPAEVTKTGPSNETQFL